MMGRLNHDKEQLLYSFHLDEAVQHDHPVRKIAAVLATGGATTGSPPLCRRMSPGIFRSTRSTPTACTRCCAPGSKTLCKHHVQSSSVELLDQRRTHTDLDLKLHIRM
jgi:hypothetical protein